MKISIITVCKNSEQTIEKTIQSVLSQSILSESSLFQTDIEIEYIIVDGLSTDRTLEIIQKYTSQIHKVISETDSGIYQAMNKGIQAATGEWLYFLNSDDYLFDNTVIQDVVQCLVHNPEYDFVYGNHEARFPFGKSSIHQPAPPEQAPEEFVSLGNCFIQPESFFKATLFQKLGLFSEAYRIAADYEWFMRLFSDPTVKITHFPRVIVSYAHGGASSQIRPLFEETFAIQNQVPLYQQTDWIQKRLLKLQQSFIDKYDLLERTHHLSQKREQRIRYLESREDQLQAQVDALQAELTALKTSKVWYVRSLWFKLKQAIRGNTDKHQ
ncbi:MAG: glycosyltransferase [Oculatellaceae cyanobacterium Prado106]|jgi:GT2 family glycosyltransferase|nr:glycosyltransferase [Oculatellaceae cyanobacterium Prado106]